MIYEISQDSRIGSRKINQDRLAIVEKESSTLLAVADGLGAYEHSEVAADYLVNVASSLFEGLGDYMLKQPSFFLVYCILEVHRRLHVMAREHCLEAPLRTTGVLCLVQRGYSYWAHVGDSRLYHIRDKAIIGKTSDHISRLPHADERRGALSQCIGGIRRPAIELGRETALSEGDTLLLCTDGVWGAHRPESLVRSAAKRNAESAVKGLLDVAEKNKRESADNMTALLFRWYASSPVVTPLQNESAITINQEWLWDMLIRGASDYRRLERANSVPELAHHYRYQRATRAFDEGISENDTHDLERYLKL